MSQIQEKKEYTAEEKAAYRQMKFDRYNAAYEEAANEIAKGGEEKIKKAIEDKKTQAILYTFYFMKDRDAKVDTKGVKIAFGDNIRMYDILTKGKGHFLRVLNAKFNKDNDSKYHCGFFRRVNPDGNGFNEWNIYVSWKDRETIAAKPENDGFVQVGNKKHFEKKPFVKKPFVKKEENVTEETEVNNRPQRPFRGGFHPGGRGGFQHGGRGGFHPGGRGGGRGGFHHRGPHMGRGYQGRGHFQHNQKPLFNQQAKPPTGPTWASKLKGGSGPLDKKEESQA